MDSSEPVSQLIRTYAKSIFIFYFDRKKGFTKIEISWDQFLRSTKHFRSMGLYGIYGSHTTESCPLNNKEIRKMVIEGGPYFKELAGSVNVKVIGQYHSGLEHTFLWVVDAKDAHTVEGLMVQAGVHKFNALTIVPLNTFDSVIEKCKQIEDKT